MEELDDSIFNKELDEIIDKIGAFCSLLTNKSMSCVSVFSFLLENESIRDTLLEINQVSWYDLVSRMTYRYPILHKSKKIKKII